MDSLFQLKVHNVIIIANNGFPVSAKGSQCNYYCKQWIVDPLFAVIITSHHEEHWSPGPRPVKLCSYQ
jgi:hypothetical protein